MGQQDNYEARTVRIALNASGVVERVTDDRTPGFICEGGDAAAEPPLDGVSYGWDLAGYATQGVDINRLYASRQAVATNRVDAEDHRNTLRIPTPVLVKLDCGLWAGYKRWREHPNGDLRGQEEGQQREFGLIENGHVWLAQYCPEAGHIGLTRETIEKADRVGVRMVRRLAELVSVNREAAIKLCLHAHAESWVEGLPANRLYVIFPDMHLPERWPDLPPEKNRYRGQDQDDVRRELQKLCRECQRAPGLLHRNRTSAQDGARVQAYLEEIANLTDEQKWDIHSRVGTSAAPSHLFAVTIGLVFQKTYQVSPTMFLAERDIVERELRLRSTWFYSRGKGWNEEPAVGETDWLESIVSNGNGDASPAVDLVNLLLEIAMLKEEPPADLPGAEVCVVQVGDVYETWINREFLYSQFPRLKDPSGSKFSRGSIRFQAASGADDYQPRMDSGWWTEPPREGSLFRHPIKRHPFHELAEEDMMVRHHIGDELRGDAREVEQQCAMPAGELDRLRGLLAERLREIEKFSLHIPSFANSATIDTSAQGAATAWNPAPIGTYGVTFASPTNETPFSNAATVLARKNSELLSQEGNWRMNARGHPEFMWNKIILDLMFDRLKAERIYGNHDGYRGDRLFKDGIGRAAASGFISHEGVWFEHSHRWDPYNRDGCAFGAGAANLTYYYFNQLCSRKAGELVDAYTKQEQKNFIPGAALWFLTINYGADKPWVQEQGLDDRSVIRNFGIYVGGHTHTGDLAKVVFDVPQLNSPRPAVAVPTYRVVTPVPTPTR